MRSRDRTGLALLVVLSIGCGSSDAAAPATASAPPIAAGGGDVLLDVDGALDPTDQRGTVSFLDRLDVPVAAGDHVRITLTSRAFDPVLEVTPPRGVALSNDDVAGDRTRSEIELATPVAGALKVQVTSFQPGAHGAY
ncbi:MAG: hypothetical protein M3Y87_26120, partial [Myxococcota bacterium]|nr:hypothetical protein [Myxococcota bacterium]